MPRLATTPALAFLIAIAAAAALAVPQARAAFPGRNGALLLDGTTRLTGCGQKPPRVVARLTDAESDPCEGAPTPPHARFLLVPKERQLRRLLPTKPRVCFLGVCVRTEGSSGGSFNPSGTRLTGGDTVWSPGRSRTITEKVGEAKLVVRRVADGRTLMVRRGEAPAWSIMNQIAFSLYGKLHVMDADGRNRRLVPLPYYPLAKGIQATTPDWSPDGMWIAFATNGAIMAARTDGTGLHRITTAPVGQSDPAAHNPIWSPDGSLIAFDRLGDVFVVSATRKDPSGPRVWTRLVRSATLLDWQAIPTGSRR